MLRKIAAVFVMAAVLGGCDTLGVSEDTTDGLWVGHYERGGVVFAVELRLTEDDDRFIDGTAVIGASNTYALGSRSGSRVTLSFGGGSLSFAGQLDGDEMRGMIGSTGSPSVEMVVTRD